jgi:hypothetical protein
MADDVVTPSNPPVAPVEQEELEETPLNMIVFQRPCEKERPGEWCALESIVWHGIIDCLLTQML